MTISYFEGDCQDSDNTPEGAVPAVDKKGNIYVSWAYNGQIFINKSTDRGKTWQEKAQVIAEQKAGWDMDIPGLDRCNGMPVTAVDNSNSHMQGAIYVVYADQKNGKDDTDIYLVRSNNYGKSWTQPIEVMPMDNGKHQFLPWISCDPRTGNIYIVFYDRSKHDGLQTDVVVAMSRNGGVSFEYRKVSDHSFIPPGSGKFFGDYNNIDAYGAFVRPIWTSYEEGKLSIWTNTLYWP